MNKLKLKEFNILGYLVSIVDMITKKPKLGKKPKTD